MVDNRQTTGKRPGKRTAFSLTAFVYRSPRHTSLHRSSSRDDDKYVNKTRMWHGVYDAMFYISTVDRRPTDIPRASCDRVSNLYCSLYYRSLQEIAVTVVKESTIRAYTLASRMYVHELPCRSCRVVSYLVSAVPRYEWNRTKIFLLQAFEADIRAERKNRYSNYCNYWTERRYKLKVL